MKKGKGLDYYKKQIRPYLGNELNYLDYKVPQSSEFNPPPPTPP